MTTATIRVLALSSLIATLTPLGLMAQGPTIFTIPFGFTVGSKTLAAGEYRVTEPVAHVLQFQGVGRNSANIITSGDEPGNLSGKVTLTFHRYGDQYFFAKMTDSRKGWLLPKSVREKALMEARTSSKPLDIVASSKR